MSDKLKKVTGTLILTTVSVGFVIMLTRKRHAIYRKVLKIFGRTALHSPLNVQLIQSHEECRQAVQRLSRTCKKYPILGFDCEWVSRGTTRNPIALMQISSYDGYCCLFRLNYLKTIQPDLKALLEDEGIVKIGVDAHKDASYIRRDYNVAVACVMDLRYMAHEADVKAVGLKKMTQDLLNFEMDSGWKIAASDWEQPELTHRQIEYAARDAVAAVELFRRMAAIIQSPGFWMTEAEHVSQIMEYVSKYFDIQYREMSIRNTTLPISGCKPRLVHEFKKYKVSTRQSPLYDNCLMEAPDGELLCTCDKSKAQWYVAKGLATLISEEPFTIRLNFEPAGRAVEVDRYYTIPKENQCVVCGKSDELIRKNVVPREYRRSFPTVIKDHTSHDVLLLCVTCHQLSNAADLNLREKLAELCDAPLKSNTKLVEVEELKKMKSAARALYFSKDKMPEERVKELEKLFLEAFPDGTEMRTQLLEQFIDIDTTKENSNYIQHGDKVVQYFVEQGGGIVKLERMWREHFLTSMKPKFLPELWSIDHNQHRLELKAEAGRVEKVDLTKAGVDKEIKHKPKS